MYLQEFHVHLDLSCCATLYLLPQSEDLEAMVWEGQRCDLQDFKAHR